MLYRSADCSKEAIEKLKYQLSTLTIESKRLQRLIEIARPAKMPELNTSVEEKSNGEKLCPKNALPKSSAVVIGKRYGRGIGQMKTINSFNRKVIAKNAEEQAAEVKLQNIVDEVSEGKEELSDLKKSKSLEEAKDTKMYCTNIEQVTGSKNIDIEGHTSVVSDAVQNPYNAPVQKGIPRLKSRLQVASTPHSEMVEGGSKKKKDENFQTGLEDTKAKSGNIEIIDELNEEKSKTTKSYLELSECDDKYSTWMPPKNQSGDGRTSLNDKYGY